MNDSSPTLVEPAPECVCAWCYRPVHGGGPTDGCLVCLHRLCSNLGPNLDLVLAEGEGYVVLEHEYLEDAEDDE
jgi:hypothetical protein